MSGTSVPNQACSPPLEGQNRMKIHKPQPCSNFYAHFGQEQSTLSCLTMLYLVFGWCTSVGQGLRIMPTSS
jgi:hypothetical protein